MNDQQAATILATHNAWRRYDGFSGEPGAPAAQHPTEIGLAIDHAIARLREPAVEAQGTHSCSYQCERPACIRAQREELVARAEAQARAGGEVGAPGLRDAIDTVANNLGEALEGCRDYDTAVAAITPYIDELFALAAQKGGAK